MERIAGRYGLSLEGEWNTMLLPHRGSHPTLYNRWVLDRMRAADRIARGDEVTFVQQFRTTVVDVVRENPGMLDAWWWK